MSATALAAEPELPDHKYVGAKKCKSCHKKDLMGDQYGKWEDGPHAEAYDTLDSDEAEKIAKEKGIPVDPDDAPECLECHVTAYGFAAAAFDKKPLSHRDGVQCESCHGPGKDYRKKKVMADREKSIAAGMWEPGKDEKICTACHNDRSPTWDPAKGFDFEAMKEKIAHPIPEDVKGRYLEIVAERKGSGDDEDDEDEEDDED